MKQYFLFKQLMYSSTGSASFFQLISVLKCRLTIAKRKKLHETVEWKYEITKRETFPSLYWNRATKRRDIYCGEYSYLHVRLLSFRNLPPPPPLYSLRETFFDFCFFPVYFFVHLHVHSEGSWFC